MPREEIQLEIRMPAHGLAGQRELIVSCGNKEVSTWIEKYDENSARLFDLIKEALKKTQDARV